MQFIVLTLSLLSGTAHAGTPIHSGGNLGLGLGSGTHSSGLSAKYFLGDGMAAQAVVGWWGAGRTDGSAGIGMSADYLFERGELTQAGPVSIAWNFGPGASLVLQDSGVGLGINGVLGLEFNFTSIPIDVVLEYRPGLRVLPDLEPDFIGFGAHIRVYPF